MERHIARDAEEDDIQFTLERHQLDRAEEIRRALSERNDLISSLQDRLHAAHAALRKQRNQIARLTTELAQSEKSNADAERRCVHTLEELKHVKETERRAKKECEKLSNSLERATTVEVQVQTCMEEIKRLQKVESMLRGEAKELEERRRAELDKERERLNTEIKLLEEQNKLAHRRFVESERQLEVERQQRLKAEVAIKQAHVERADFEARMKILERDIAETSKKLGEEKKRAERAEDRVIAETQRLEEALKSSIGERVAIEGEVIMFRRHYSELEEQNTILVKEIEAIRRECQDKTETYAKELRRKNAGIFELENKLRGLVFTSERKLLRAEKEWESRLREVIQETEATNATAKLAVKEHSDLISRCEHTEKYLALVRFQRDYFINLFEVVEPLLRWSPYDPIPHDTIKTKQPKRRLKAVVLLVLSTVRLKKQSRQVHSVGDVADHDSAVSERNEKHGHQRNNEQTSSFVWSFEAILRQSCCKFAHRVSQIINDNETAVHDVNMVPLLKEKSIVIRQDLSAFKHRAKVQAQELAIYQERTKILEERLEMLQKELSGYHDFASELKSIFASNQPNFQAEDGEMDLVWITRHVRRKLQSTYARIKKQEQLIIALEKERDDALIEAKNAREMTQRVERYAESEIASLTRTLNSS